MLSVVLELEQTVAKLYQHQESFPPSEWWLQAAYCPASFISFACQATWLAQQEMEVECGVVRERVCGACVLQWGIDSPQWKCRRRCPFFAGNRYSVLHVPPTRTMLLACFFKSSCSAAKGGAKSCWADRVFKEVAHVGVENEFERIECKELNLANEFV